MASFRCKDIGERCGFEVKSENRDELVWVAAMHAEEAHNMKRTQAEMMDKIKKAVKK